MAVKIKIALILVSSFKVQSIKQAFRFHSKFKSTKYSHLKTGCGQMRKSHKEDDFGRRLIHLPKDEFSCFSKVEVVVAGSLPRRWSPMIAEGSKGERLSGRDGERQRVLVFLRPSRT
jgi:hypothetical protein